MNNARPRGRPTVASWATYRQSIGDRSTLFSAVASGWASRRALYPGSYLDLSPSTAIHSVTYIDTDRRAGRYFADHELVAAELKGRTRADAGGDVKFLPQDYTTALPLPAAGFDLLISLFAGPVWDHCQQYLAPGGLFLANTSHADGSLAALDPHLELVAAVHHRGDAYHLDRRDLNTYLVPKKPSTADADLIRRGGRGIPYTRDAFAYLFRLG